MRAGRMRDQAAYERLCDLVDDLARRETGMSDGEFDEVWSRISGQLAATKTARVRRMIYGRLQTVESRRRSRGRKN